MSVENWFPENVMKNVHKFTTGIPGTDHLFVMEQLFSFDKTNLLYSFMSIEIIVISVVDKQVIPTYVLI